MLHPDQALQLISENLNPLPYQEVPLTESVGQVLAQDIHASVDLPHFDNSAMDGYAVISDDLKKASKDNPVSIPLRETIRAGSLAKEALKPGEAMKIMTGATTPLGADAVVMKEKTEQVSDSEVRIYHAPKKGDHIRKHGEDVQKGALVLKAGIMIRPHEIAFMASQGISKVPVVKTPVVSVLATGDELVPVAEPLAPGRIRNSNGPAVVSALRRWGVDSVDFGIAGDEPSKLEASLRKALASTDAVVVTGGVSVGDYDFTREIFSKLGIREVFWKLALKPGKPLLFGVWEDQQGVQKPVFGLPGNPISVLVCVEEFVRPALEKLRGCTPTHPSYHMSGTVTNSYKTPEDRQQFVFCRSYQDENGKFLIDIIRPQGSAMMGMACTANALAVSPVGVSRVEKGDVLKFRWLK